MIKATKICWYCHYLWWQSYPPLLHFPLCTSSPEYSWRRRFLGFWCRFCRNLNLLCSAFCIQVVTVRYFQLPDENWMGCSWRVIWSDGVLIWRYVYIGPFNLHIFSSGGIFILHVHACLYLRCKEEKQKNSEMSLLVKGLNSLLRGHNEYLYAESLKTICRNWWREEMWMYYKCFMCTNVSNFWFPFLTFRKEREVVWEYITWTMSTKHCKYWSKTT